MKRPRPDVVYHDRLYGPMLLWNPDRRCPKRCEYRGEDHYGDIHIEYRRNGDKARPVPMLRLVKR